MTAGRREESRSQIGVIVSLLAVPLFIRFPQVEHHRLFLGGLPSSGCVRFCNSVRDVSLYLFRPQRNKEITTVTTHTHTHTHTHTLSGSTTDRAAKKSTMTMIRPRFSCCWNPKMQNSSIHPFFTAYLGSVHLEAALRAEKPRLPSPQPLHPALLRGSRGVPSPAERHSPFSMSWVFPGASYWGDVP